MYYAKKWGTYYSPTALALFPALHVFSFYYFLGGKNDFIWIAVQLTRECE
jgi:hypothetical protein